MTEYARSFMTEIGFDKAAGSVMNKDNIPRIESIKSV